MPVIRRVADEHGASVIMVEQHVQLALEVADEAIVLVHGSIVLSGLGREVPGRHQRGRVGLHERVGHLRLTPPPGSAPGSAAADHPTSALTSRYTTSANSASVYCGYFSRSARAPSSR